MKTIIKINLILVASLIFTSAGYANDCRNEAPPQTDDAQLTIENHQKYIDLCLKPLCLDTNSNTSVACKHLSATEKYVDDMKKNLQNHELIAQVRKAREESERTAIAEDMADNLAQMKAGLEDQILQNTDTPTTELSPPNQAQVQPPNIEEKLEGNDLRQYLEKEGKKLDRSEIISHGTKQFRECQSAYKAASNGNEDWNTMYSSGAAPTNLTTTTFNKMVVILAGAELKDNSSISNDDLVKVAAKKARACAMFAFTAGENFTNEKKWKEEEYKPNAAVQKSFDGRIKCTNTGPETIDFDDCMNVLNAYNGSQIVQTGNDAIQQFRVQSYQTDQQLKMMNANPTEEDTSTLALKTQKDGIDKMQGMAEERRALQAAKLALMISLAKQMPQNADAIDLCATNKSSDGMIDSLLGQVLTAPIEGTGGASLAQLSNTTPAGFKSAQEECQLSFNLATAHGILQNQSAISTAYAIAAEAGVEVAKEQVAVTMLGKQKKLLGSIIDKVEDAEVMDLPDGFASQEELMNFCDLNPLAVECNGLGTGFTTHIGGSGAISINGSIGTNSADSRNDDSNAIDVGDGTSNAIVDPSDIATSTVGGSVDKASGFVDPAAARAKVSSAQVSGAGAGGGGSASASGLSGGSGGNGATPNSGSRYKSPKISYSGGGRSLSFSGGSGAKRSSNSKDAGNPFAKMFAKNKDGSNVINFRDLASQGIGGKSGNIFERITNKYSEVNKKDRLLKYSTVDKE